MKILQFIILALVLYCNSSKSDPSSILTFLGNDDSPKILIASPSMGQKNLQRNVGIDILFSKPMNINSCVQSFSITPNVLGYFDLSDITLKFTPSNLLAYGSYTYLITKNCESKDGDDLKDVFSVNFSVGESAEAGNNPQVVSLFVSAGSVADCNGGLANRINFLQSDITNVCMGNPSINELEIVFDRSMDQSSVISAVQFSPSISANFVWNSTTSLRVIPDRPLNPNTRYTVSVSAVASDAFGNRILSPVIKSFYVGSNNLVPNLSSISVPSGTLADCLAGIGISTDIIANSVTNGCLGNPTISDFVLLFDRPMDRALTQSAVTFSPSLTGTFSWAIGDTQLTFVPDAKLIYGNRYTVTVNRNAISTNEINLSQNLSYSFIAGGAIGDAPFVQAVGVASQSCSDSFPGVGSATGGNWLLGQCYWDSSLPMLNASSYTYRAGDDGTVGNSTCADVNTDNFKLIFSKYMDTNSTLNAVRLRRISPPSTIVQLSSWIWKDCQATFPFGCRVLELSFAEQEASCNGSLFGNAGTSGDFNLMRTDNSPIGYPYYLISVDTFAKDTLGVQLQSTFNFTVEGK
ncbi:Ig-like domain-containing protein [Leptospira sp. 96542]|nr:Ig-like domain-containing protein [Leptospira sp. 96542]